MKFLQLEELPPLVIFLSAIVTSQWLDLYQLIMLVVNLCIFKGNTNISLAKDIIKLSFCLIIWAQPWKNTHNGLMEIQPWFSSSIIDADNRYTISWVLR